MKTSSRSQHFALIAAFALALDLHSPLLADEKPAPAAQKKKLTPEEEKLLEEAEQAHKKQVLLSIQDKYAESEKEARKVIAIRERVLGPEHSDTLQARVDLANQLLLLGREPEVEKEFRAILAIRERVLGPEHGDVAWACYRLACSLHKQGKLMEALPLIRRAEDGMRKAFGPQFLGAGTAKVEREEIEAELKKQQADRK